MLLAKYFNKKTHRFINLQIRLTKATTWKFNVHCYGDVLAAGGVILVDSIPIITFTLEGLIYS